MDVTYELTAPTEEPVILFPWNCASNSMFCHDQIFEK